MAIEIVDLPINMVIFHSFLVSLPGTGNLQQIADENPSKPIWFIDCHISHMVLICFDPFQCKPRPGQTSNFIYVLFIPQKILLQTWIESYTSKNYPTSCSPPAR